MERGRYTIPSRVYLTGAQREQLMRLLREREIDLDDLLTELLESFLTVVPDEDPAAHAPPAAATGTHTNADRAAELRRRRSELRRLRMRLASSSTDSIPPWMSGYLADLETEVRRLEAAGGS